jgi:hypothetical protein
MRESSTHGRAFAEEFLQTIAGRTDLRIDQRAKNSDMGVVISTNPLVVRPAFLGSGKNYAITSADIMCDPDADFVKGEMVICVPMRGGYWWVASLDEAGDGSTTSEGGGDTASTTVPGVELDPGLLERSASDRIVARAKQLVGKLPENGAAWTAYMNPVNGYNPWCAFFISALYKELKIPGWKRIGDGAVAGLYNKSNANERITNPQDFPGCIVIKLAAGFNSSGSAIFSGGDHTCLFIEGNARRATTIGGNEGDNVSRRTGPLNTGKYKAIAFVAVEGLQEDRSSTDVTDGGI